MTLNDWLVERTRAEYIAWHEADWYYTHGKYDAGAECYRQARAIGQQIREALDVQP